MPRPPIHLYLHATKGLELKPGGRDDDVSVEALARLQADAGFAKRIEKRMAAAVSPGAAGAAIEKGSERLGAVLHEGALPAARNAPRARLEEIIARRE